MVLAHDQRKTFLLSGAYESQGRVEAHRKGLLHKHSEPMRDGGEACFLMLADGCGDDDGIAGRSVERLIQSGETVGSRDSEGGGLLQYVPVDVDCRDQLKGRIALDLAHPVAATRTETDNDYSYRHG